MLWCLLLIIISGIVAVKDLSKAIDGYIHIASPGFQFLTDCTRFRRIYGWQGLLCYSICLLSMLAFLVITGFRLFNALSKQVLIWTSGAVCTLLLLSLLANWLTIRSKGSDQVEELMDEKWKAEKRIAPEHNEEVDLYQSAVLCNRTLPFINWHIIGILGASLILFFTL